MNETVEVKRCIRCFTANGEGGLVQLDEPDTGTAARTAALAVRFMTEDELGVCLPCVSLREPCIMKAYTAWFQGGLGRVPLYTEVVSILMRGMV